jgi:NTP pyrophosphatase (non-canonical NTP hydrolase)
MNPNYNDLQKQMLRTAKFDEPLDRALGLCGLGLSGEAGEIADLIKKVYYHGKPFDREKLIEEGGDLAWYVSYLAYTLGWGLADLIDPGFSYNTFNNLSETQRFTRLGGLLTSRAGRITEQLDFLVFEAPEHIQFEKPILQGNLASLLGWLEALAIILDSSLVEMCQVNITKLNKRYPNGFSTADSIARVDVEVPV